MSRPLIALALVLAPVLLLQACASADDRRAAAAAAHACHIQFPTANDPHYDACVAQMESNIRDARAYHKEPEHPQHGGRGGHGGGGGG